MTEQEVDRIDEIRSEFDLVNRFLARVMRVDFMRELGATDEELDAMLHHRSQADAIFASLRYALKDTERIDAMQRCLETFGPDDCEKRFVWPRGQTLRQAIDERRGA